MLFNNQDLNLDQNSTIVGDNNFVDQDLNVDINVGMNQGGQMMEAEASNPIIEPMQERCVHRTIVHQVPQV